MATRVWSYVRRFRRFRRLCHRRRRPKDEKVKGGKTGGGNVEDWKEGGEGWVEEKFKF